MICLFVDNAVDWLSGNIKGRYCSMRLKKYKEEKDPWPPIKTKSYVTLAIVHQNEVQTRLETTATIYLRTKGDIHEIPHTIGTEKLTDVTQIFDPVSDRVPTSILIEGHAGIGKTTFVKEMCIEWAEGKLLTSDKLVLLLLLRDPNVQKITNEHKLIEHFTKHSTGELHKELVKSHGTGVTLIIDGFDELDTILRDNSFIRELIEKRCLPKAKIVVTSRPSASACLHDVVDRRLEILGFEQSSRNQYISEALQNSPYKLEKLQRHFQQYPNIDAICYIPLILSIIVFLCMCQSDKLPPTATEMYASFILHTICHYLKRVGEIPEDKVINNMEQFPPVVYKALQQLEKTAFDGLVRDKIVFTVEELPVLCKDDSTCYGLLQSTECYSAVGIPIRSFNFLHLGIQEYFAAKYVTTLPEDEVYTLLKESFVITKNTPNPDSKSVRLSNMWILYCGITSGQCKSLRYYLTNYGISSYFYPHNQQIDPILSWNASTTSIMSQRFDPLQPSFIYPSYHSVTSPTQPVYIRYPPTSSTGQHITSYPQNHLPTVYTTSPNKQVNSTVYSQVTSEKITGPSQQGSTSDQRISITRTISQHALKDPVKVLYLFQCFQEAQDNELCEVLSQSFDNGEIDISSTSLLPHQVVSLGFFLSRSHRKWKKLNLNSCNIGDRGISIIHQYLSGNEMNKQEITEINLSYNNLTGVSLHLIADINNHLQPHTLKLSCNNITNVRNISTALFNYSTVKVLHMTGNGLTVHEAVDMMICLEELDISYNKLGDHGAKLLSQGMTNTKTLRELCISSNNIGPSGTTAIANALANNTTLQQLKMHNNKIGQDGALEIAKAITNNKTLKTLTLGDNTMDEKSAMIIMRSLHHNNTITDLGLHARLHNDDNVKREFIKINYGRNEYNVQKLVLWS